MARSVKPCRRRTKDIEYTWKSRGHELVDAHNKRPIKSMSEDIKSRTTIRTLGQPVTKAPWCTATILVSSNPSVSQALARTCPITVYQYHLYTGYHDGNAHVQEGLGTCTHACAMPCHVFRSDGHGVFRRSFLVW